jgi:hypothetical protein
MLTNQRLLFIMLPLTLDGVKGIIDYEGWVGRAIAGSRSCLRKVRAPMSTVPGNTRAE